MVSGRVANGFAASTLTGDLEHAWQMAGQGALYGAAAGGLKGFRDAKMLGNNPWTGNSKQIPFTKSKFGHSFDSQIFGISYLLTIGLPSLISAGTSSQVDGVPFGVTTHDFRWYEMHANRHAARYLIGILE